MNKPKHGIFICDCSSTEHQVVFHLDEDEKTGNSVSLEFHLSRKPFWQRVIYAIRYTLGRQCRYGAFEEFIMNPDDSEDLQKIVNHLKTQK